MVTKEKQAEYGRVGSTAIAQPVSLPLFTYSYLRAAIGSTLVALFAGM
jgi:hypothetical protein